MREFRTVMRIQRPPQPFDLLEEWDPADYSAAEGSSTASAASTY